ncbi:MAG: 50S ribosomal protein L15 [Ignavibacteria bacterium GWA2_35_9]|nr:MAG: 50S ribosomal protein L15 [Ignavibacteria bacterium GWA2_35_9]OGU46887.1 MAG: 50S ribosomal protein L15 [Ignavibacteria bacterium GWB2_36_8]OGU52053.1 MAG: 50S ribosomal protein L15 [Ignavibacteria bacterium GWC2_36_12]OGV10880.1 MAG: 50S ribosomal protein L15 [Ignavibacteria bacterium RIFOXYB2_FULL_36_7]
MDILSNLKYAAGSRKKRKRVARGEGSGHGGTATRGMNGQLSRSGAKKKIWFEGGQMPLQRRVPKFGFTNIFKKEYQIVNLNSLQKLSEKNKLDEIILNAEELKKLGLINNVKKPVKILGNGEFKVKVQLEVSAFSNSAKDKIEAAGGSIKKI